MPSRAAHPLSYPDASFSRTNELSSRTFRSRLTPQAAGMVLVNQSGLVFQQGLADSRELAEAEVTSFDPAHSFLY